MLGMAFKAGCAFAMGRRYAERLAQDSDENVKFRTTDNGNIIAIKDGEVVGGSGASVGPDKLPTFAFFASAEERKEQSFTKTVTQYARENLKPVIEALRFPKGMPADCERILMGKRSVEELAAHMNDNKARILPFIPYVYRNGTFTEGADTKHADVEKVIYTTADVKVGEETFRVTVQTKKKKPALGGSYVQYGVAKADKKTEATDSDIANKGRAADGLSYDGIIAQSENGTYEFCGLTFSFVGSR